MVWFNTGYDNKRLADKLSQGSGVFTNYNVKIDRILNHYKDSKTSSSVNAKGHSFSSLMNQTINI